MSGPAGAGPLDGASPALAGALTVRFLLELALLTGAAVLVWRLLPGPWQWLVSLLAVGAVAAVWGLFCSPKATIPLPPPAVLAVEAALFLGVGAGLFAVGVVTPAVLGVVAWAADRAALALLRR